jgi:hypothetical protein
MYEMERLSEFSFETLMNHSVHVCVLLFFILFNILLHIESIRLK